MNSFNFPKEIESVNQTLSKAEKMVAEDMRGNYMFVCASADVVTDRLETVLNNIFHHPDAGQDLPSGEDLTALVSRARALQMNVNAPGFPIA